MSCKFRFGFLRLRKRGVPVKKLAENFEPEGSRVATWAGK